MKHHLRRAIFAESEGTASSHDVLPESEKKEIRWFETEIAIGSIVGVLLLTAGIAVWILVRRKRKATYASDPDQDGSAYFSGDQTTSPTTKPETVEVKKRKMSTTRAPHVRNGVVLSAGGGGLPESHPHTYLTVPTVVVENRPSARTLTDRERKVSAPAPSSSSSPITPWEPYFLGVPGRAGKKVQARRRSVSLRADSDSDLDSIGSRSQTPSPNPSGPSGPNGMNTLTANEDEERSRKRSVTFNEVVEEVQILRP